VIDSSEPPSFDELFAATGGARLGMRARANQKGKLLRTQDIDNKDSAVVISSLPEVIVGVAEETNSSEGETKSISPVVEKKKRKKDRKPKN
jgi:hypothetical protein